MKALYMVTGGTGGNTVTWLILRAAVARQLVPQSRNSTEVVNTNGGTGRLSLCRRRKRCVSQSVRVIIARNKNTLFFDNLGV
jgi:hypothetical protein